MTMIKKKAKEECKELSLKPVKKKQKSKKESVSSKPKRNMVQLSKEKGWAVKSLIRSTVLKKELKTYIKSFATGKKETFPTIEDFVLNHDTQKIGSYIYEFCASHKDTLEATVRELQMLQKHLLISKGLNNDYKQPMCMFVLKNVFDWKDRKEETTHHEISSNSDFIKEVIGKIRKIQKNKRKRQQQQLTVVNPEQEYAC